MPARFPRRALLGLALKMPVVAAACGGSDLSRILATSSAVVPTAAPSETPLAPTFTPIPATATPPPPDLQLLPGQIDQGGVAVIVLNEPASSATASFQGRQYPMLRSGERSWAIVGVGAFAQPQLYPVNVSFAARAGPQSSLVASLAVARKEIPVENIVLDTQTASLLAPDIVQAELAKRAAIYSGYTAQKLWSGTFVRPNAGPYSSPYGVPRSYNGSPPTDYHRGTDFAGESGSPVIAAASGRVAFTGELRVRGNSVIVDHGMGVFTAYHHLSRIDASDGATVSAGQQVGLLGATGLVDGPHLHWEVIVRGVEVDGRLWLERPFGL